MSRLKKDHCEFTHAIRLDWELEKSNAPLDEMREHFIGIFDRGLAEAQAKIRSGGVIEKSTCSIEYSGDWNSDERYFELKFIGQHPMTNKEIAKRKKDRQRAREKKKEDQAAKELAERKELARLQEKYGD